MKDNLVPAFGIVEKLKCARIKLDCNCIDELFRHKPYTQGEAADLVYQWYISKTPFVEKDLAKSILIFPRYTITKIESRKSVPKFRFNLLIDFYVQHTNSSREYLTSDCELSDDDINIKNYYSGTLYWPTKDKS